MRFNQATLFCLGLLLASPIPSRSENLSQLPVKEQYSSDQREMKRKLDDQKGNIFKHISISSSDVLSKRGQTIYGNFNAYDGAACDIDKNGEYMILGAPTFGSEPGAAYIYKYDLTTLEYNLHQVFSGGLARDMFGFKVAMSCDAADAIAIVASGQDNKTGSVRMFRKDSSGDFVENSEHLGSAINENYGAGGVQISCDGSIVMVGTCTTPCGGGAASYIDFYKFNQNTAKYDFMQTIGEVDYGWGQDIALSGDGTTAVVGSITANGFRGSGTFYRLDTNGNQYTQIDIVYGPSGGQSLFGRRLALSHDGNLAVFGAQNTVNGGTVFLLHFDGSKYETVQEFTGIDMEAPVGRLGNGIAMSSDGSTVIAGSYRWPTEDMVIIKLNPDNSLKCSIVAPNAGYSISMRNHEHALVGKSSSAGGYEVSVFKIPDECPTEAPTMLTSEVPTTDASDQFPFSSLSNSPSSSPNDVPSSSPFNLPDSPSSNPDEVPSRSPFAFPDSPSESPVQDPTNAPVSVPTRVPVSDPTKAPVSNPTKAPISVPTRAPLINPTKAPVFDPTPDPTKAPVPDPTPDPTHVPSKAPVAGTSCPKNKKLLVITMNADNNGAENKIIVKKQKKNGVGWSKKKLVERNNFQSNETTNIPKCLPKKKCYQFKITDKGKDGICCEKGEGSYSVEWKGKEVANSKFKNGGKQVVEFNCD